MRKKHVALILDHPQRDMAGLVLTAFELCQRGATCHLVPRNRPERETFALAPDFVLLNFLRAGNESFARMLADAGIRFGLLDTEGGVWSTIESYTELLWTDSALLRTVHGACMWGPKMADALVDRQIFTPGQVKVTGCPRFDLYHPLWRAVVPQLPNGDSNTDPSRKRILINTNFSISNPRFASAASNFEQFRRDYGWSEERIRTCEEVEQRAIDGMITLARDLARDYPDADVVLRPHPFENVATYQDRLGGIANVLINASGPVQPQIAAAAVVIQRSCSTAIEARLSATPTLSPQWIVPPEIIETAEAVSEPCASYAELREKLDAIFAERHLAPTRGQRAVDEVIHGWFHQVDGLAHVRVSDVVLGSVPAKRLVDERLCVRYMYGLTKAARPTRSRLGRSLRHAARVPPDWCFRQFRSVPRAWKIDKQFGVAEVRNITERIQQALSSRGGAPRPVTVMLARERGDYLRSMHGVSVTMSCD